MMKMDYTPKSIRTFIGAKDFEESKTFYEDLGFTIISIAGNMVYIKVSDSIGFYLQKAYVKKWVDNSMIFLEVDDLDQCYEDVKARGLVDKYKLVRLSDIKELEWGREFFLHDPSGVLWHFGHFYS
jgi:catechol 2,3-dioxygenase-like lactoylglutathione lyase family enzyme